MHVAAIIVAAGSGSRLGADSPKQFLDLGAGHTMLQMSIEALSSSALVSEIVVALPPGSLSGTVEGAVPFSDQLSRGATQKRDCPFLLVEGGARRQDSVANAFARASAEADVVVIHDAARPFVTQELVDWTIRAAAEHGAAIAAVPVIDTVKQAPAVEADGTRIVRATLPRDAIFLAQTPQAFRRDVLAQAMAGAGDHTVTDEAMLVERAGFPVHIVEGDAANVKVTTSRDLEKARARVASGRLSATPTLRIGNGYDLHRLVAGRPLILAGVRIPFDSGLLGHSDADIVCHAVTDAVLGAAGLGDIGRLFPDTEPAWKDADSVALLAQAMALVRAAGFVVVNVDATVIAERPKLLPYLDQMRSNLARVLAIEEAAVSVKGKTNEQVGEIGRGEAMACHAVALIKAAGELKI